MPTNDSNKPKETQPFDFVGLISLLIFIVTFILGVKCHGISNKESLRVKRLVKIRLI